MILEEETYNEFGYYPRDLKPKSNKRIFAACDECGKIREMPKGDYRSLCHKCAMTGERHPMLGTHRTEETKRKISEARKGLYSGNKSTGWKGGSIKRICKICGKEFEVNASRILTGGGKFCSLDCKSESQREQVLVICGTCKKPFTVNPARIKKGNKLFCSRECSYIALSKCTGEEHPNWRGGKVTLLCKQCGKEFKVKPSRVDRGMVSFCSHSCSLKARRHNTKPKKTHPELIFEKICKKYNLPFRFVGDGTLWIGRMNPDFIHKTRKVVCEVFGDYWHSPLLNRNIRSDMTLDHRRKQLKAEGYKLIVLWESDLKREDAETFVLRYLRKQRSI